MTELTSPVGSSAPSSRADGLLRIGMIGCGALGLVHASRLNALPAVEVRAVSDPDESAMRRVAGALLSVSGSPAPHIGMFPDYRDLLAESALDAVCISSPNPWHVAQLLASLDAGLHVLCEKPLSMDPAEVTRVVEATAQRDRIVAIAYQSRYRSQSRILRRALASGRWGRITSINAFACEDWVRPNVGTWRHDPARCPGGYFGDANGHQIDLICWLTGLQADWVRATIENRGTPVPMATWGEARMSPTENRAVAGVDSASQPGVPFTFTFLGDARQWREEISIQTEGADFVLRDTRLLFTDGSALLGPLPESEIDPADTRLPNSPDEAFIAALRGGAPVVSEPHTVWPVLRFTLATLASAANQGRPTPARP